MKKWNYSLWCWRCNCSLPHDQSVKVLNMPDRSLNSWPCWSSIRNMSLKFSSCWFPAGCCWVPAWGWEPSLAPPCHPCCHMLPCAVTKMVIQFKTCNRDPFTSSRTIKKQQNVFQKNITCRCYINKLRRNKSHCKLFLLQTHESKFKTPTGTSSLKKKHQ